MVTWLTTYWWVIILIIIIVLFILWNTRRKNISFDFSIDQNALGLFSNLINMTKRAEISKGISENIGLYLPVPITTMITNNSGMPKLLKNIKGSISYNGQTILQTKPDSTVLASVEVPANATKSITDNVQVLANQSSIKLFTELIQGKKPIIEYNFSITVLGKEKTFTNKTTIK